MTEQLFRVVATRLNLRSMPVVRLSTRLATLAQGDQVEKLAEADALGWWRVAARVGTRQPIEGFVAHRFLEPVDQATEPSLVTGAAPAVHLEEGRADIRRARDGGHAYPLGEPGRPGPLAGDDARRADGLRAIIDWLLVEQSARYQPKPATTYCNIYAYDVCYLAGVYLPRVWWTGPALARLARGEAVVPHYDVTVRELNANALCDWLEDHGPDFDWRRSLSLDEVQGAANAGALAVICAQRADLARSGHISVAAPEHDGHRASRRGAAVERPLQSQAGRHNFAYGTGSRRWWLANDFARFGFWINRR